MTAHALPLSIQENPRLEQWVDFTQPGVARVFTAKVELGQGIVTAMAQIAAEELRIPLAALIVVSGDTRYSPNEGYTAGSMSIEIGGTSLRIACAEARGAIVAQAAQMLGADEVRLSVDSGMIMLDGVRTELDYWKVAPHLDWKRPIRGTAPLSGLADAKYIGRNVARFDLPQKVSGGAFIHDLEMPGMIHGRVMRPPANGAHLVSLDISAAERVPGVLKIFRSGDFAAVCCEREFHALKALEAIRAGAKWTRSDLFPIDQNWRESLPRLRAVDSQVETGRTFAATGLTHLSATYSKPPLAHGAMGPACAIARMEGERLTVWTHSQGVFPLRGALAKALGIAPERIDVIHVQGAGCYGHNAADDAAMDAAILAREMPSRPVRVQWMRGDELAWAPFGSPMVIGLSAALTPQGRIADWSTEIWSGPYGRRPNPRAVNLLGAAHLDPPIPFPDLHEDLARFAGAARNSDPPYDVPHRRTLLHSIPDLPLRTSSLRSLGAYANVFASESFIDELAERAGVDPVEFRLRHLSDPRARRVIETAARISGWRSGAERGNGRASGIGFSRYKNTAAYVAVAASVELDREVRVSKVYCAVDAGLVINPDGVINQIEGSIIQSISWTLKEQVRFGADGAGPHSWEEYPILGFDEVPEVMVELISDPESPPLGVGEAAQGPAAAAVANAVARALGTRIRDLPITRERIEKEPHS